MIVVIKSTNNNKSDGYAYSPAESKGYGEYRNSATSQHHINSSERNENVNLYNKEHVFIKKKSNHPESFEISEYGLKEETQYEFKSPVTKTRRSNRQNSNGNKLDQGIEHRSNKVEYPMDYQIKQFDEGYSNFLYEGQSTKKGSKKKRLSARAKQNISLTEKRLEIGSKQHSNAKKRKRDLEDKNLFTRMKKMRELRDFRPGQNSNGKNSFKANTELRERKNKSARRIQNQFSSEIIDDMDQGNGHSSFISQLPAYTTKSPRKSQNRTDINNYNENYERNLHEKRLNNSLKINDRSLKKGSRVNSRKNHKQVPSNREEHTEYKFHKQTESHQWGSKQRFHNEDIQSMSYQRDARGNISRQVYSDTAQANKLLPIRHVQRAPHTFYVKNYKNENQRTNNNSRQYANRKESVENSSDEDFENTARANPQMHFDYRNMTPSPYLGLPFD